MIQRFLAYVEIKTKITSLFAFAMTIAWMLYRQTAIRWDLTMVFFASMLLFDLTTTAINNYIDTRTNDQVLQFSRPAALAILWALLIASTATGLYLAWRTDVVVLLAGALCFMGGILYTYGPVPISRQPWGEIVSGVFYGLFIPFLILYINSPQGTYLALGLSWERVTLSVGVVPVLQLMLFSVIPVCTTANIMLANNICDVPKDVAVKRYTLPYYLGPKALYLLAGLYYLCYGAVVAMVAVGMLPWPVLLSLLTLVIVRRNIKLFFKKQDKGTTFIISIQNFVVIMGSVTALILLSWLLGL